MKNVIIALAAVTALSACTTTEKDAAAGALIGGAVGAVASGGQLSSTLAGAAIGGVAGVLLGRAARRGDCVYRDRHGRRYVARCPRGYNW